MSNPPKTPDDICDRHSWMGKDVCDECGISRKDAPQGVILKRNYAKLKGSKDKSPKTPIPKPKDNDTKPKKQTNVVAIDEKALTASHHYATKKAVDSKKPLHSVLMTYEQREAFDKLLQKMSKGGRPTDYDPRYHPQSLLEYFSVDPYKWEKEPIYSKGEYVGDKDVRVPNDPPFLIGWCLSEGLEWKTVEKWFEEHKEFAGAKEICNSLFERFAATNGMHGIAAGFITGLALKNKAKWADKVDTTNKETKFHVHIDNFEKPEEDVDEVKGEEGKVRVAPRTFAQPTTPS